MSLQPRRSEQRVEMLEDKARRHDKLVKALGKERVEQILTVQKEMAPKTEQERAV